MKNISIEKITFANFTHFEPGKIYQNYSKSRGVCGIVVAIGGSALYTFSNGEKRIIHGGEIAVFSGESAYILENTADEDFVHYTINFTLCPEHSLFADECYFSPESIGIYADYCQKILEYIQSAEHMRALSVLYNMLADILDNPAIQISNKSSYKNILPAINYIETEYQSNITTDILANECMMSNTNFRRIFTSVCGVSPIEYLINVRIERAVQLLHHTTLTVAEISAICGFKDVEYFSRTFKKRMGRTASEFRKGI